MPVSYTLIMVEYAGLIYTDHGCLKVVIQTVRYNVQNIKVARNHYLPVNNMY